MTELNRVEFALMNNPVRRASQRWIELPVFERMMRAHGVGCTHARILDAGCGEGHSTELIAARFVPRRLVGVDLMSEQIERARKRAPRIEFHEADLAHLDGFESGSFDAVFVLGILHHIPAWRAAIAEISRVLVPGGLLLVEELRAPAVRFFDRVVRTRHPKEAAFDWPELRNALHQAGMPVQSETLLVPGMARAFLATKT